MMMVMITSTDNRGRVERSDWSGQRQQERRRAELSEHVSNLLHCSILQTGLSCT